MTEYVAPALAVYYATPAPLIEFATPSPVIEYSALAPSVTCFTPSPQSPLACTMAAVTTGATVDTTRSVYSQFPITDVGASASQVTGSLYPVETMNIESETSRRVNLWGAAMSDDAVCPGPRLCGAAASTTGHFDLTADDSPDECLADGMPSCEMACPCRTSTPHRDTIGCTARRWPVRTRGTCDARHTTQEHKENRTPTRRELQILGGRIGLFVEWADHIETEGGTMEEQRLEYRELLGDMAVNEEDLNGAELECYSDLTTIAWWEHDETEDAERELRIL